MGRQQLAAGGEKFVNRLNDARVALQGVVVEGEQAAGSESLHVFVDVAPNGPVVVRGVEKHEIDRAGAKVCATASEGSRRICGETPSAAR